MFMVKKITLHLDISSVKHYVGYGSRLMIFRT